MATNFDFIKGFFTIVGSADYPKSWNPNDNFGFDLDSGTGLTTGPVFNFSYSDVINGFLKPIESKIPTSTGSVVDDISSLIVERPVPDDEEFKITSSIGWNSVYRVLEYVFFNQDTLNVEDLETEFIGNSQLIATTTNISRNATKSERIDYVTFSIDFDESGSSPDRVDFKIYFYADTFMYNEAVNKYEVYFYEDLDDDDIISKAEWESQIIQKHLNVFKNGRYKFYKVLTTNYIEGNTRTDHTFYVYTIIDNFDTDAVQNAVREYLLDRYSHSWCVTHYPNLFSGSVIDIIPIESRNISNSLIPTATFTQVMNTLTVNGYNATIPDPANNVKNLELFKVGNESLNPNPIPCLIIAIDVESDSIIRPISNTFPNYTERYVAFEGYGPELESVSRPLTFHHLLYVSLCVAVGVTAFTDINIVPTHEDVTGNLDIPSEFEFSRDDDFVYFRIFGIKYRVRGF